MNLLPVNLYKDQYRVLVLVFLCMSMVSVQRSTAQELLSKQFHAQKRNELRALLPDSAVAVILPAVEKYRSNDVEYPFHQYPDFYYLTGISEPSSMLFLFKEPRMIQKRMVNEVLFIRDRNPSREVWTGKRLGVIGAEKTGLEMVLDLKMVSKQTDLFPKDKRRIHIDAAADALEIFMTEDEDMQKALTELNKVLDDIPEKVQKENNSILEKSIAMLRQKKEREEIALCKRATDITVEAQKEILNALHPGLYEYQLQAVLEYVFKNNGAETFAFPSIVGSGENSCILHYTENSRKMNGGDLVVVDIGASYHGYAADVTRTLPVSGTFSPEQKQIYQLVYDAQQAGIKASKPGNSFGEPGEEATKVIASGLKKLGIISHERDVRKYFIHGTSHYVGLDVHDAGTYGKLKAGDLITVEPGVYIPSGSDCDQKWWNIGVRIEDDVLILENGYEVISAAAPSEASEIEKWMKSGEKSMFRPKK